MGDARLGVDVADDLRDQRIAGLAAEIARGDQAGTRDLALPAGESLAIQQMIVERTQRDAVRVDNDAAMREQDFPAHHVGDAVQFALGHRGHVGAVEPVLAGQLGIAPELELPVRVERPPGVHAIGRAAALVAHPDEMHQLRDHSAGPEIRVAIGGRW